MNRTPKPMERYRHFKGQRYQIITLAEKEDTGEQLVIYQALYGDGKVYARSLDDFLSEVDREKYPDAVQRYRFERIVPEEEEKRRGEQEAEEAQNRQGAPEPEKTDSGHPENLSFQEEKEESSHADRKADWSDLPEKETPAEDAAEEKPAGEEEVVLDPLLEAFLDARTTEEKLTALDEMRGRVTDEMIDTMALACGVEVGPGATVSRYEDLRDCLVTIEKYELERGRLRG